MEASHVDNIIVSPWPATQAIKGKQCLEFMITPKEGAKETARYVAVL
jgi:hypothetical protein